MKSNTLLIALVYDGTYLQMITFCSDSTLSLKINVIIHSQLFFVCGNETATQINNKLKIICK